MKTGQDMRGYDDVFGLKSGQRRYPYEVTLKESSVPGNVFVPGEKPVLTFQLTNNLDEPIRVKGKVDVIAYGTRGIPNDIWLPEVVKFGDLPSIPIEVDLGPKQTSEIRVEPDVLERFGGYALIFDLPGHGRRFGTSLVRTFPAAQEKVQYPKMSLDHLPPGLLQRLGIQAVRFQCDYVPTEHPQYQTKMAQLDKELRILEEHNVTVMLMFMAGAGDSPQPLGRPRPHLEADDTMRSGKSDHAWLPENDPDFAVFVERLVTQYGWPKGPVTSVLLWNEPWEGMSISGWAADMIRYREMFTAMAEAVEKARTSGVEVLITGADSSSNTWDKFFSDGSDTFLKWLDACTIHYQGLSAPSLYKKWINRESPQGRVRIWDTESWTGNTDDRLATVLAVNRAAGYDRSMGIYRGYIASEGSYFGTQIPAGHTHTWSPAAAVGAAQHFLGERDFQQLLFTGGLPWIMVFDGLVDNPDDGTIVVVGDIGEAFGADHVLFRGVRGLEEAARKDQIRGQLAKLDPANPTREDLQAELWSRLALSGGSLKIAADPRFRLHDFYGNIIEPENGHIQIPLDFRGFYLRTDGSSQSFADLLEALRRADIQGYEPLDVVLRDMTRPIGQGGVLKVDLTNILNRKIEGSFEIRMGSLEVKAPDMLEFEAHEKKTITVELSGEPSPDNLYPVHLRFDAERDGHLVHEEAVRVNFVARRNIEVNGTLDDWEGVLPQTIRVRGDSGPTLMEAAWLPFEDFKTEDAEGVGTGYLAHDDEYFYFAAKIADHSPHPGTFRFETIDEDQFFYPEKSFELDREKTIKHREETWNNAARAESALLHPTDLGERSFVHWRSVTTQFSMNLSLPGDRVTRVSFYFVDPDPHHMGRRSTMVVVRDAASLEKLAEKRITKYGPGNYASFEISGDAQIDFVAGVGWLGSSLSGIFFDSTAKKSQGVSAAFISEDLETRGDWKKSYGHEGYHIMGTEPQLPSGVKISMNEEIDLKEHVWPAGVRRYSYRKRPVLPFGNAPKFDNVQIAFNVVPIGEGAEIAHTPGTMPRFTAYQCTDYEYALNHVAEEHGGGTEIWRLLVPGMVRKHFYPRQPACEFEGAVKDGKLVIRHEGSTRIVEAAIPWTEMPKVRQAVDEGRPVKFSFRINDDSGPSLELAEQRSASKINNKAFHADWVEHWANEIEFGFEK